MAAPRTLTVALAGCPISIVAESGLSTAEEEALRSLIRNAWPGPNQAPPFRLELHNKAPWRDEEPRPPAGAAARISLVDESVAIDHHDFRSTLNLTNHRGLLRRQCEAAFALEITLRTAMCCGLPLSGGVALHSAGIVVNELGVAFFGPSGAGKSTLSSLSPHPVVSDELIAVAGPPWTLRSTGSWGELGLPDVPISAGATLGALVELAKGDGPRLERVPSQVALRRLLRVLVLPPAPVIWQNGLRVAEDLCRHIPAWRLQWSPDVPPWHLLEDLIRF